jgi:hypothetical protein
MYIHTLRRTFCHLIFPTRVLTKIIVKKIILRYLTILVDFQVLYGCNVEHNHECWIDMNLEGGKHGQLRDNISEFS